MTRPTDEMLMAYADDVLDPADRARVEAHLATDAEARAIVEMFRRTAALSREAHATPLREPVPEALMQAILKAPAQARQGTEQIDNAAGSAAVVDLASRRRPPRIADTWRLPIAASLALLVGLGAGYLASRGSPDQGGNQMALGAVEKSAPLATALEHKSSGSTTGRHVVVATFRDKQDRACREIEVLNTAQPRRPEAAAVACRGRDGTWTVEGAARVAAPAPAGKGIEPSGVAERDALDGLLNMLGAKPVLSPAEEKSLIERGWR